MNFIKKIFDKEIDKKVHLHFQKFSRGKFPNRALVRVKKLANGYSITTSSEFSNELVEMIAEKLGGDTARVTGAVVSTNDLTGQLEYKDKKQFQGVKKYLIDKEMSGNEIIKLIEKFPKSFFALSFEYKEDKLKIKPKAPQSGKPGKEDGKPKADFCSLKTCDKKIAESFVFERTNFKEAEIFHDFIIEEIKIREDLKKSEDFAKIREESERAGKIIRKATIDGEKINSEAEFAA